MGATMLVGGCGDGAYEPVPRDKAEAASKAALLLQTDFTSYAAAYAEEEKAHARITGLRDAVNVCREPLREWLRRFAEEISGENLTLNIRDFSFEEMPFSSFGEESLALRTTIAVDGVERPTSVTTDLIVLRVGNVIAGLDYTTTDREADGDLEERLMTVIEKRTRESAESLK